MAKVNPLIVKIVFIGVPFLVAVALLPTNTPDSMRANLPTDNTSGQKGGATEVGTRGTNLTTVNGMSTVRPGLLPPTLTHSQEPWAFVGVTDKNGAPQAQFENRTSHEAVFLRAGDIWKGLKLASIGSDNTIVVLPSNVPDPNSFVITGVKPVDNKPAPVPENRVIGNRDYSQE